MPDASRVRRAASVLLGRNRPGRSMVPRPSDTFIVSFPKSGNTWMRFLLANALYADGSSEGLSFGRVGELVPDLHAATATDLDSAPDPRLIKSHDVYDPRYPRVVLVVRDPRDVAVSYHHHLQRHRAASLPIDRFVRDFVEGSAGAWGSWNAHVASWLGAALPADRILMVRYEDMKRDAAASLRAVLAFLGREVGDAHIESAVEASAFDALQLREQSERWNTADGRRSSSSSRFMRKGVVGAWSEELEPGLVSLIEDASEHWMRRLGYERSSVGSTSC